MDINDNDVYLLKNLISFLIMNAKAVLYKIKKDPYHLTYVKFEIDNRGKNEIFNDLFFVYLIYKDLFFLLKI